MDQKFEKWDKWIETIYYEVVELVIKRQIFEKVQDIIRRNPSIQKPSSFWSFLEHTYIAYSIMAVRRQIKSHSDSISFNELNACIDCLQKLTRKYRLLIQAQDAGDCLVINSIEDYSEEIFRQPWILPD